MMPAGLLTVRNFPFLMRAILSHLPASSIYGVETRIVIPSFFSLPSISQNSFLETGSTPVVGSSRNRTLRLVDQCAAKGQLLLHSTGQFSGHPCLERLDLLVDVLYQVVVLIYRRAEQRCEERQVLFNRKVLVKRELSWHITDDLPDLAVILHGVESF